MKMFIFLCFLITASLIAQVDSPKIIVPEKEHNFGNINEGEVVSHNFVVYNRGEEILKIKRVKASCGCTAAEPTKNNLLPGDSTSIKVEFNSQRRKGAQKKFVYVFSNDPKTPQMRLVFSANVIASGDQKSFENPSLKLSKYNHNFGNVKEGEILDLKINVSNNGDADLKIKKVKSSCGCTAALMSSKLLKPNETSELKIEFDTKNLSGQIARTITLYTNDPKHPTRVLTLIANIEEG